MSLVSRTPSSIVGSYSKVNGEFASDAAPGSPRLEDAVRGLSPASVASRLRAEPRTLT